LLHITPPQKSLQVSWMVWNVACLIKKTLWPTKTKTDE